MRPYFSAMRLASVICVALHSDVPLKYMTESAVLQANSECENSDQIPQVAESSWLDAIQGVRNVDEIGSKKSVKFAYQ